MRLTWSNDVVETKDLLPLLANYRSLVQLRRDDALFSTLAVSDEGDRIVWDGGFSLTAGAIARLPQTSMSAEELRAVMAELNMSSEGLAALLGISRRAITDYRAGSEIPRAVVLSMNYSKELAQL